MRDISATNKLNSSIYRFWPKNLEFELRIRGVFCYLDGIIYPYEDKMLGCQTAAMWQFVLHGLCFVLLQAKLLLLKSCVRLSFLALVSLFRRLGLCLEWDTAKALWTNPPGGHQGQGLRLTSTSGFAGFDGAAAFFLGWQWFKCFTV